MPDSENDVKRLLELDGNSGKLEYDERGFIRFIPSDEEKAKIESWLMQEISQAEKDYAQRYQDSLENNAAYKAVKEQIDGETATLPVPLAAIAADQVIADTYNTIMRPRPVFSIDAYFPNRYPVPVPVEVPDPMTGQPMQAGVVMDKDAEEIAKNLQSGVEFKVRERLNFGKLAQEVITDVVTDGALPAYVKVCADRSIRTILRPKVQGITIDLDNKEEYAVKSPNIAHWYSLPKTNILKPIDEDDLDESPWVLERTPIDPETFTSRVLTGEYPLIDKDKADEYAKATGTIPEPEQQKREQTQKRGTDTPRNKVGIAEVWFYRWVKYIDPDDGQKKLKRLNLVGDFHTGVGKLCNAYLNWYEHQCRPIVPFWQIKDPHSDTGMSTVDRVKWHQRVLTHAAQSEIKNSFHANNFAYWWTPDSPAADYFQKGGKFRAGEGIDAGKFNEDWGVVRAGEGFTYSMLPLMQWVEGAGQRATNVSSYEQGEAVPGRTPAATVAQILGQGKQQPIMFLRTLNDGFSRVLRLFLETERQFQPFGETIPIRDPQSKAVMEIPFRYPVGEGLDNFRIALTASDEALAKEHEFEQQAIKLNQFMQYSQFIAQVAGPMGNGQATPAQVGLFNKILEAANTIFLDIVSDERTDDEKFDFRPEFDAIKQEGDMARMAMQQQQMMGGMNAGAPQGGGPMAGPAGQDQSGAMPPMAGGPDNAQGAGEDIPPPPPPDESGAMQQ